MMDKLAMAKHLLPRQLVSETFQAQLNNNISDPSQDFHGLGPINKPLAMSVIGFSILSFIILLTSIRYTLGIVSALAMVETPKTTYLVSDEKAADASDPEVLVIVEAPITNNIRRTIRHLVSRGGRTARWRGFSLAIVYTFAYYIVNNMFSMFSVNVQHGRLGLTTMSVHILAGIAAELLLARLATAWTHVVISEPSTKSWFSRVPPMKTWKKVALPTAVRSLCFQLTGFLPAMVFFSLNINEDTASAEPKAALAKLMAVAAIGFMTFIGIYIPSEVTLTRVQASLLPEEDETIVNVDRTFNGRVVPEILGGSGCVSFMGAWKSFDGAARVRLLKLFAKWGMIELALHIFFALVICMEFVLIKKYGGKSE